MNPETSTADSDVEILVVEDSQTQALQLELFLEQQGYGVSVAHDGEEALAFLNHHKPKLILSDILMPKMDGFELCRRVTENEALKDVPIIFLSQLSDPKDIEQGLESGALAFIVKPYRKEALLNKINSVIAYPSAVIDPGRGTHLLVVEDSKTQAEHIKYGLEQYGFTVALAANGIEALAKMRERKPDVIISDALMPEMDGYDMCQHIRQTDDFRHIPVVMLTSLLEPKDVIRGIVSGVDYYLTKPFEEKYLLAKIDFILKGRIGIEQEPVLEDIDFMFEGKSYCISMSGRRLLNLLLSTYENAVWQNQELRKTKHELTEANTALQNEIQERKRIEEELRKYQERLEELVGERTAKLKEEITERKRAQEELAKHRDHLEKTVEERTAEVAKRLSQVEQLNSAMANVVEDLRASKETLETTARELADANEELESFSYSVSHDLRAPLRAIDGFSKMLVEDYGDKLDEDGQHQLDVIRSSARDMGQLIDDLLAFSRLGRKDMSRLEFDMAALVREVSKKLQLAESQPTTRVDVQALPLAFGDQAMIREVVANLLSNAFKFTTRTEDPSIVVGCTVEGNENIYCVKDNGVGFDMKYKDKLFRVFQRLHSAEEFPGTGIGLALVQRIVHRHGGRVWAEGKVNGGASVYFTLPRGKEKEDA